MTDSEEQDEIERAAAEWVVRLGAAPLDRAERHAFDNWCATSPAHRAAFEHAYRAWTDIGSLKDRPGRLRSVIAPVARPASRRGVIVGLAVLIACAAALLYQIGNPWIALAADYRTGPGEIRTVRLIDGTLVDLGAASAIAVTFDNNERRVQLLEGEAYFTVAPKQGPEHRPFVAIAAEGSTTALGTQFAVENVGGATVVTAVEHQISVALTSRQDTRGLVLSPGDTVQYDSRKGLGAVRKTDTDAATAWRRGMLVFDGEPLSDVVARLNRYRRGKIVVMNRALASRRVSGVFPSDNLDNVVDTITAELGVRSVSAPPLVTLLY